LTPTIDFKASAIPRHGKQKKIDCGAFGEAERDNMEKTLAEIGTDACEAMDLAYEALLRLGRQIDLYEPEECGLTTEGGRVVAEAYATLFEAARRWRAIEADFKTATGAE